jgi:DeoR family fructose operon transcriptional repressor
MFAASEATIRRDLTMLERQGLVERTHGGAVSRYFPSLNAPFPVRDQVPEKKAIAVAAAELVSDDETIVLDAGTTTAQLARALVKHRNLTVITNSTRVMNELYGREGVVVIVTGGELLTLHELSQEDDSIMTGSVAEAALRRFRPSKVFLSTAGITLSDGLTTASLPQAQIKQLMIEISTEVILLTDSSKFGRVSYSVVAPVDVLDRIITDSSIKPADQAALESRGIDLIVAEAMPEIPPG